MQSGSHRVGSLRATRHGLDPQEGQGRTETRFKRRINTAVALGWTGHDDLVHVVSFGEELHRPQQHGAAAQLFGEFVTTEAGAPRPAAGMITVS